MHVLAIVQAWNANDAVLGFTIGWIEAIADRVDHVTVLAREQRHGTTRENIRVRSLGREGLAGHARKPRLLRNWHLNMQSILRDDRPDVIFTHMTPTYSVLAWPYARANGVPIVTWYAQHGQSSWLLRVAHTASSRVVSINPASYPFRPDKVVGVGHGIDTSVFRPGADLPTDRPALVLSVGRISPIKDLETFVRAIGILRERDRDVRGVLVGEAPLRDRRYVGEIRELIGRLGLENDVELVGAVPPSSMPTWYHRSFAHVNLPARGALDKAALEAMACATPSFVANDVFGETLGHWRQALLFRPGDPFDLAARIGDLLALPSMSVREVGMDLRRNVIAQHSLSDLADRLVRVFETVCSEAGRRESGLL
jgi:glycosyltransferase involved in cell wall biosynthesis